MPLTRISAPIPVVLLLLLLMSLVPPGHGSASEPPPTLTIAMAETDWPPFFSRPEATACPQGMLPAMLKALFVEELGWQLRYLYQPWSRAQNEVRLGNADILLTVPTATRLGYTRSTALPFLRLSLKLYTYADHPRLEQIREIRSVEAIRELDLQMVSNQGNNWFKTNIEAQGIPTTWVNTDEQIIRFLALKRADATIEVPAAMNLMSRQLQLSQGLVQTEVSFGPVEFFLLLGKKSPLTRRLEEINLALASLSAAGTFQEIRAQYQPAPPDGRESSPAMPPGDAPR
ncbi:substrate-binding periplasmic protein [Desulfogranum mediterraneum]|uniref:substrate-binding periplasmic protein n=1 Tax=Desulfogranum mediterraneum TaxID=160661 RepID=UPI000403C2CF|nr:transporter substrate-binding domain-containing protein [Desulfogranum mediterraneum]